MWKRPNYQCNLFVLRSLNSHWNWDQPVKPWFIREQVVLDTGLLISCLEYSWRFGRVSTLLFLNISLGSRWLSSILCFYGSWVVTDCHWSSDLWSCYYLGRIISINIDNISVVGMEYVLAQREATAYNMEYLELKKTTILLIK